ncbi:hypothetical protein GQ44DRAFT_704442 [Phaeosphaeriaceae sp. PMI808]|nr:hypothetical protein GQ44DRAFT_704442 [Phaeosphaeriaceae sp. PMI808]
MQAAVAQLASEVSTQIGQLDQTMKELLQFEFAWVSINEAHKSTSIATSIKRLSWITFIFLPAMFASSLFGMNVDILRSNPDWRWYLLFGGGLLALTVFVWLLFKYGQMEQLIERNLGDRFRRWSNGSATRANHMRNDHSTLPT